MGVALGINPGHVVMLLSIENQQVCPFEALQGIKDAIAWKKSIVKHSQRRTLLTRYAQIWVLN